MPIMDSCSPAPCLQFGAGMCPLFPDPKSRHNGLIFDLGWIHTPLSEITREEYVKIDKFRIVRFLCGLAVILSGALFISGVAFGQAVSQISGIIRDASGAVVPAVEVTATQTDTGV